MEKENNPNETNLQGAFQNAFKDAIQKRGVLFLFFCFLWAIYWETPDEQKIELLKEVVFHNWICTMGWVLCLVCGVVIHKQRINFRKECKRMSGERDKNQKQRGIEIESSNE